MTLILAGKSKDETIVTVADTIVYKPHNSGTYSSRKVQRVCKDTCLGLFGEFIDPSGFYDYFSRELRETDIRTACRKLRPGRGNDCAYYGTSPFRVQVFLFCESKPEGSRILVYGDSGRLYSYTKVAIGMPEVLPGIRKLLKGMDDFESADSVREYLEELFEKAKELDSDNYLIGKQVCRLSPEAGFEELEFTEF